MNEPSEIARGAGTELKKGLAIHRLDKSELNRLATINQKLFKEKRLINSLNHRILIALLASLDNKPIGFKIGYSLNNKEFYSAKGGVLPEYRRIGIATKLLHHMLYEAGKNRFAFFVYDTFPEKYPEMYHLGLREGFAISYTKWNVQYQDYQVRLWRKINPIDIYP